MRNAYRGSIEKGKINNIKMLSLFERRDLDMAFAKKVQQEIVIYTSLDQVFSQPTILLMLHQ